MTVQQTLCIIKPDAVQRQLEDAINDMIVAAGLTIREQKRLRLTQEQAESFYAVHRTRPFFDDLCRFMTSGDVMVQLLEGDDAVQRYRDLMGATNPSEAAAGTIRAAHGQSIQANSVHGSDSLDNAQQEIAFFFASHQQQ